MALHLREIKRPNLVLDAHCEQIRFLREKGMRNGRKSRVCKEEWFWLGLLSISCSYETKQHTRGDLKR